MRLMSFSMTTRQYRAHEKTETMRLGWADLRPGELFRASRRGRG